MGADGDEVGVELVNIGEGKFAGGLDSVRVEQHAALAAEASDVRDGLDGTDLVVGGHDRDEGGVGAQGGADGIGVHLTV